VPATPAAVDVEAAGVRAVGNAACPMRVALERVIATSTGTVIMTDTPLLQQGLLHRSHHGVAVLLWYEGLRTHIALNTNRHH
jgi:hypothetical protein